jgi:mannose-6-phosphate isomerase
MNPQVLPPNVLRHFYAGGERIAALRGLELDADHTPEEWIGAVNTMFGSERGLSRFQDGTLVRDAIAADPEAYLGADHAARYGASTALLVKLLDAGQRLPAHFHPGRAFAREAFGSPFGKTEAWLVVEAEPGAAVWAGFNRAIELDEVRAWMAAQDAAAMLAAMHQVPVSAGDAIFVPAGTPHAIGEGMLIVELQEPTDMSVTLEWEGFELSEDDCHLGLGWDRALQAMNLDEIEAPSPAPRLPGAADAYFRAERLAGAATLDQGFSILVGLGGSGTLATEGGAVPLARGSAVLVPYAAGSGELRGDVTAIRCRPPAPGAGDGEW